MSKWRILLSALVVAIAAATAEAAAGPGAAGLSPLVGAHVVWRAAVGGRVQALAAGDGAVWVATGAPPRAAEGRLLRLDPETGLRVASIPVGWWPSSVALGAGSVWVADSIGDGSRLKHHLPGLEGAVTRIDPATNQVLATIRLPGVESLAVAGGAVWATTLSRGAELLSRIDPRSDRVVAKLRIPGVAGPLAVGGGKLWALTWFADPSEHARISEIDPRSDRLVGSVLVRRAGPLSSVVYRRGVLWVGMVNPGAPLALRGRIVRIDARTLRPVRGAVLVPGATALTVGKAGVWAAGDRWLVSLNSAGGAFVRRFKFDAEVPSTAQSIAAGTRTVWVVAGSDVWALVPLASTRPADYGVLQRFAPRSASTWWAIVASNLTGKTWLVRTSDSGRDWLDVTPPLKMVLVSSSFFLGRDAAWMEGSTGFEPRTEPLYRTLDGGRTWRRLATLPADCQLDFVDRRHGWCAVIGAASGSSTVRLYRTRDGGSTWTLVSRTGLYGASSTPGALPYGCDKTIAFTSLSVGWAVSVCAGGPPPPLYESEDGGAHWRKLAHVPLPKGAPTPEGADVSVPAVSGSRLALSIGFSGTPKRPRGATAIATSGNGGRSWRAALVPGQPEHWNVDLLDPRHWRLNDGATLLATDDAGGHWRRWKASVKMTDSVGAPLALDFLSPRVGFAVPDSNSGSLWWTRDGGTTWHPITITAGPFTLPH
jgi:hypothetical protein